MPTQEQINAANLELQIASDNYNRAQNKIDQYDRLFNSYMNMSDEKKKDPRMVSAMKDAIADYNNLKLQRTTNAERMNNAQVTLNEYSAQAAAQQQAANR
jgi:predicted Zn-dependent protease